VNTVSDKGIYWYNYPCENDWWGTSPSAWNVGSPPLGGLGQRTMFILGLLETP